MDEVSCNQTAVQCQDDGDTQFTASNRAWGTDHIVTNGYMQTMTFTEEFANAASASFQGMSLVLS